MSTQTRRSSDRANLHSRIVRVFPRTSGILSLISAKFGSVAKAEISREEVRLVSGAEVFSMSMPSNESLPKLAELAVNELMSLLEKPASRKSGLRLVVSDHWLRPLIMRLGDASLSDDEIETVLTHQYQQLYGRLMVGWTYRWDCQSNGLLVAMAWPDAIMDLRSRLAKLGVSLVSALPQSLSSIRELSIPIGPSWFVLVGSDCATFIRQDKEGWEQWRVLGVVSTTAEAVLGQLARMVAQLDDPCRDVWIQAPGYPREWLGNLHRLLASAGWRVHLSETVS